MVHSPSFVLVLRWPNFDHHRRAGFFGFLRPRFDFSPLRPAGMLNYRRCPYFASEDGRIDLFARQRAFPRQEIAFAARCLGRLILSPIWANCGPAPSFTQRCLTPFKTGIFCWPVTLQNYVP
jgi:hypothetical protein